MRKQLNFKALSLMIGLGLMLAIGQLALAQEPGEVQITMSPAKDRIEIAAGKPTTSDFTIINSGQKAFKFKVYASPYSITNTDYNSVYDQETPLNQINRWIKFDKNQYELAPGKEVKINYRVETPADIPDGAQYAVIFAETEPEQATGQQLASNKRVGLLVYAHGGGETRLGGESLAPKISFWQTGDDLKIDQQVKNTGNTDFKTDVTLKAKSLFGEQKVIDERASLRQVDVLPETTRSIQPEWKNPPQFGIAKVTVEVKYLDKTDNYDQWVLFMSPLVMVIAAVVIIVIIGSVVYGRRKPKVGRRLR